MPAKRKKGGRSTLMREMRTMKGGSFGSFLRGAVSGLAKVGKVIGGVAKNVVSNAPGVIAKSGVVGNLVSARNPIAGAVVKAAGLGRKKRGGKRMGGRGNITNENAKVLAF